MEFLTSSEEGEEIGRRVAAAGREWALNGGGRVVDRGVWFLRVLLEVGWLQDGERRVG